MSFPVPRCPSILPTPSSSHRPQHSSITLPTFSVSVFIFVSSCFAVTDAAAADSENSHGKGGHCMCFFFLYNSQEVTAPRIVSNVDPGIPRAIALVNAHFPTACATNSCACAEMGAKRTFFAALPSPYQSVNSARKRHTPASVTLYPPFAPRPLSGERTATPFHE